MTAVNEAALAAIRALRGTRPGQSPASPDGGTVDPEERASLDEIATEGRRLMDELDDVPWPQMNAFFYAHAYDELRLILERILDALDRERPDA